MDMSAGHKELIGDATAIGTGVLAWMYASTGKMDPPSTPLKLRFEDALANTLGRGVVKQIDPAYAGAGDLTPKFWGFLNPTTFGGVALLIADHFAMGFPKYRNDLDGLHNIVEGAGWGLTLGGAAGGIFDPDSTQSQGASAAGGLAQPQAGNVPYGRAYQGGMVAVV